ncbi:MAG TPA: GDSL-type esterase/lipase family protein [Bryobacteraceae bacterium]|nr:GDSL-type esterase/lipase family protein [Bryobacteraceae bacterium]
MIKLATYISFFLLVVPVWAGGEHGYTYLALGDSLPFGMNVTLLPPYSDIKPSPAQFTGYPESVADIDRLLGMNQLINASCPGETSGSFLVPSTPDNGCNSPHYQPPAPTIPPFKSTYGLHVSYTGSQMAFAATQLETNKNIKLVTLSIGADDILLNLTALADCTTTACADGILTPILQTYGANLATILGNIRALYSGKLILLTYYSPSPALNPVAQALNSAMTAVAAQFPNITIANGYAPFQTASAPFNGDPCQAGLLVRLPPGPYTVTPCDVHPSPLGRSILSIAVELAALAAK